MDNVNLAHPGKRYQGQFIDGLIAVILFAAMMYLANIFEASGSLVDIAIILVPFSYFVFADALPRGQSVGKKLLGISVVSKDTGEPCTLWQSFIRNAFTPILSILDAVLILGEDRQRIGDKMANTMVIKNS